MTVSEIDEFNDIDNELPFELMEHVTAAVLELLPAKSRENYINVYKKFKDWQSGYGVNTISSNLILAYFHVATLRSFENIDF